MNKNLETLKEFVSQAERNRKYPPNTASGLKAALKLFESEANEDEVESLDKFKQNFEQIYSAVFQRNKTKMTTTSIEVYKSRVQKLIKDYESYGDNPTKFASWSPTIVRRSKKSVVVNEDMDDSNGRPSTNTTTFTSTGLTEFKLPLDNDRYAMIYTPKDLTENEFRKIKGYIDYLGLLVGAEQGNKE